MPERATPETLAAMIAASVPSILLLAGTYPKITVPNGAFLTISGDASQPFGSVVVEGGVVIQGTPAQLLLQNFKSTGGGISGVDAPSNITCRGLNVHGAGVGYCFTGGAARPWGHDVTLDDCRAQDCGIGRMFGEMTRFHSRGWWADRCQGDGSDADHAPTSDAFHPSYVSDQGTCNSDDDSPTETRCMGTGSRGTFTRVVGYLGWRNARTVSCGRGCERMDGCTLIDSGPLEINSYVPCSIAALMVDNPSGPGVVVNPSCISPWLQFVDPRVRSSEEAFRCMALHQDLALPNVRHQQFDIMGLRYQSSALKTDPAPIPPNSAAGNPGLTPEQAYRWTDCLASPMPALRTPEQFFAQLGPGYTVDQAFNRAVAVSPAALRQFCRGS